MALTPRLVTRNSVALAIAMLAGLLTSIWAIVEFAPGREITPPAPPPAAVGHPSDDDGRRTLSGPFAAENAPADDRLCAWTAHQIFKHYAAMNAATETSIASHHADGIAGLMEAYLDLRCPAAIHDGDWHVTAQILGVGLVYERVLGQPYLYAVKPDPRAIHVLPIATDTFDVLAPNRLCEEAIRGHGELQRPCLTAFGR